MSMYNLIHGENPFASVLLAMLGLNRNEVPRYRDCWWTGEHIAIHTRTGGGNREDYQEGNAFLQHHATYVRDADDDFDSTYATFYFLPPTSVAWVIPKLQAQDKTPGQRWEEVLEKMKTMDTNDPQIKRIVDNMKPIFEKISAALKGQSQ